MSYVKYEKKYVATYKELFLTFIAFCVILFVLYPKDLLKDQILSESSNYDLSMLYLENMLNNDPSNEDLMIILAEQSLRSGKRDLSFRLLELLYNSKNKDIKKQSYLLSYTLAKEDYFFIEDEIKKNKQMAKTKILFNNIMDEGYYELEDHEKWYEEAIFTKSDLWSYYFLKQKIKVDHKNINLLEEAYYISTRLDKTSDSFMFLHLLQKYDEKRRVEWITAEYNIAYNSKNYMQAEMVLKKHAKSSKYFQEKLAKFYLQRGAYVKSSNVYMDLYKGSSKYSVKRKYFLKSLSVLQSGNYLKKAVVLASKYENRYINDRKVRISILKLYIAAGNLNKAGDLAEKLLKKRR